MPFFSMIYPVFPTYIVEKNIFSLLCMEEGVSVDLFVCFLLYWSMCIICCYNTNFNFNRFVIKLANWKGGFSIFIVHKIDIDIYFSNLRLWTIVYINLFFLNVRDLGSVQYIVNLHELFFSITLLLV